MSDMLSHWAVFEDCRKIAALDTDFDAELTGVIEKQLEYARLGTVSRSGTKWMKPVMERAKAAWGDPAVHPTQDRKLAFDLGGLPHQAIDSVIKPCRGEVAERDEAHERPLEDAHRWLCAYHDAFLIRRVFTGGDEDGQFDRFLPADDDSDLGRAIEAWPRRLRQFPCSAP